MRQPMMIARHTHIGRDGSWAGCGSHKIAFFVECVCHWNGTNDPFQGWQQTHNALKRRGVFVFRSMWKVKCLLGVVGRRRIGRAPAGELRPAAMVVMS